MKTVVLVLALLSANAYAAQAFFTGNMRQVQSVTGAMVWNCEYMYAGQTFWRAYPNFCPANVEVY